MRSVLLVGALLTLAGCVQNSSPFVGHWVGRGTAFSDAARHDIELDLKKDGTYTGQNTFFASGETFRGQGTWQQTSPVDAVAIDRSPGERFFCGSRARP